MKPILFNTEMVRAILDGRKTVTRRVVKHGGKLPLAYGRDKFYKLVEELNGKPFYGAGFYKDSDIFEIDGVQHTDAIYFKSPYQPGDILYVRETFCTYCADHVIDGVRYAYKADATPESERIRKEYCYKYRPSIHMPREAARIFLRVTDVRVERLQDITEEQAIAEGVRIGLGGEPFFSCKDAFVRLWDSTLPKNPNKFKCPENSWITNPFVWVIEFEKISKEDAYNA